MKRPWLNVLPILLLAACSKSASPPPSPSGTLDRGGLEIVVGRRVRGDSVAVSGARFERGWLVSPLSDTGATWSLRHVRWQDRDVILLQRVVGSDGAVPVWTVTDAGRVPQLPRGHRLATSCGPGTETDPRIFAIVRAGNTERLAEVRWAWLANTATGRIDTTATLGLQCENEEMDAP